MDSSVRRYPLDDVVKPIHAAIRPSRAVKGVVVLLVEDEPAVRLVMADSLIDNGFTVLEADNGAKGLRIALSSTRIDLLLTDVGLPGGMNGRQLADAVRQHRPNLKVLFVTGYDETASLESGLMDDGMSILTKPFLLEAFASKVHSMIDR